MSSILFDHVHIMAQDPAAASTWFADMLGAEVIHGPVRIEARLGGLRIFFDAVKEGQDLPSVPAHPHRGLDHLAFAVQGIADVVADLKAKGATFTKELQTPRPGVSICFIEGPEGISIELLERA